MSEPVHLCYTSVDTVAPVSPPAKRDGGETLPLQRSFIVAASGVYHVLRGARRECPATTRRLYSTMEAKNKLYFGDNLEILRESG